MLNATSKTYSNIPLPMRRKNVFKAYFCAFHLRMRGPWYATKRLYASFATAIFRKKLQEAPVAKSINMVWVPHIVRVRTKNILNLGMGLFKALYHTLSK